MQPGRVRTWTSEDRNHQSFAHKVLQSSFWPHCRQRVKHEVGRKSQLRSCLK